MTATKWLLPKKTTEDAMERKEPSPKLPLSTERNTMGKRLDIAT